MHFQTSLSIALAGLGAISLLAVGPAEAQIECRTTPSSGAAGLTLEIGGASGDKVMIRRAGPGIGVYEAQKETRIPCTGPPATRTSLDRIKSKDVGLFYVELSRGAFGPGKTPEAGTGDIEIYANSRSVVIGGTFDGDDFAFGRLRVGPRQMGAANLDADSEVADADLYFTGQLDDVASRAGNDTLAIGSEGDPRFTAQPQLSADLDGGGGNDTLTGGAFGDTLFGGAGTDELVGLAGSDTINGGPGKDAVDGGDGPDAVAAADGETDDIDCGNGRDGARADRFDLASGCETLLRLPLPRGLW